MRVRRLSVLLTSVLLVWLVGPREATACLWVTGTSLGGDSIETDPPQIFVEGLLEAVEAANPGEYVVATNLGTAYELHGDNREALRWISEGLRRNPDSHAGTEWLHVRILEAKLALAADPDWLRTHTVLGADFGAEQRPRIPASWPDGRTAQEVEEALYYQLHERLPLVAPPDAIVSDLLFDFGNLLAGTRSLEHAMSVYRLALRYGDLRSELIEQRRSRFELLQGEAQERRALEALLTLAAVIVGLIALVAVVVLLVRRRRRLRAGLPRAVARP